MISESEGNERQNESIEYGILEFKKNPVQLITEIYSVK
jgi:hypothetical protein